MICHLCISLSHLVIILYDTILTLSQEKDLVWGRQFRLAAVLYMMARYGTVLYFLALILGLNIATTAQVFVCSSYVSCGDLTKYFSLLSHCIVAWNLSWCVPPGSVPTCCIFQTLCTFWALLVSKVSYIVLPESQAIHWSLWKHFSGLLMARTYAICNHNRVVLAVLGILLIGSLIPAIVCGYKCIGDCESLTFHSWWHQFIAVLSPLQNENMPFCMYFKIWSWDLLVDMQKSGVWHILLVWRVDL